MADSVFGVVGALALLAMSVLWFIHFEALGGLT